MPRPGLYTVLVDWDRGDSPASVHCGFQQARRSWFGHPMLDVCMVRVDDRPDTAAIASHGTYRHHQFCQLAAVSAGGFPPPLLELNQLAIEPVEILQHVRRVIGLDGPAESFDAFALVLRIYEGSLAWQAAVEVTAIGMHTVILAASDAQVLSHKFHRLQSGDR